MKISYEISCAFGKRVQGKNFMVAGFFWAILRDPTGHWDQSFHSFLSDQL